MKRTLVTASVVAIILAAAPLPAAAQSGGLGPGPASDGGLGPGPASGGGLGPGPASGGLGGARPVSPQTPATDRFGHRVAGSGPVAAGSGQLGLPARPGQADDPVADWSLLGPPGGDVFDVAASTTDPDVVLAGTAPAGGPNGALYRSTDGGASWSPVPGMAGESVFDLAFAPDGTVYAGTSDAVQVSTDDGATWARLDIGTGLNQSVNDVTIDPSDPDNLWASVDDAFGGVTTTVLRSTDGGLTWTDRTPPAGTIAARGVAVDPTDPGTVVAVFGGAFGGGAVWVSTNGGESWVNRSAGLPANPIQAVVFDGQRLLVGGGLQFGEQFVGLYQSTNLGGSWTPLHDNSWPVRVVDAIAVDPVDPATILVATDGSGVHRSTDGGRTWQLGVGGTEDLAARSLRHVPGSASQLLLGTSSLAVFRSADGGDSFRQSAEGISELGLTGISANPRDPDELAVSFEGQNDGGVYTSVNGGRSWALEPVPPSRYSTVGYAPDGTLYAMSMGPSTVAPEGLYRRTAGGDWQSLGPDQGDLFESELFNMAFSATDPELILLGGNDFGVAGFDATIWRSGDGGGSWSKTYESARPGVVSDVAVVADGTDQQVLAGFFDTAGTEGSGGALRSADGGRSWRFAMTGLPGGFFRSPRLCAVADDPETFYLSALRSFGTGEVFRTTEAGRGWEHTGWTGQSIRDIACDPADGQVLYVSQLSLTDPVARSGDGGATFVAFKTGITHVTSAGDLAFAGQSRLLLASRQGSYATAVRDDDGGGPVRCDETITGTHDGPLTVDDGVTCLGAGARVLGEVNVLAGAGLVATAAVVQGPVSAFGASVVALRFSQLTGPVLVSGATGSVTLFASQVTGSVSLLAGTGGTVASGNTIIGSLSCFGNDPAPVDQGLPNTVTGGKLGQCADL